MTLIVRGILPILLQEIVETIVRIKEVIQMVMVFVIIKITVILIQIQIKQITMVTVSETLVMTHQTVMAVVVQEATVTVSMW